MFTIILLQVTRALAAVWCCGWALIAVGVLVVTGSLDGAAAAGVVAIGYAALGVCVAAAAWVLLHHVERKQPPNGFDVLPVKRSRSLREGGASSAGCSTF